MIPDIARPALTLSGTGVLRLPCPGGESLFLEERYAEGDGREVLVLIDSPLNTGRSLTNGAEAAWSFVWGATGKAGAPGPGTRFLQISIGATPGRRPTSADAADETPECAWVSFAVGERFLGPRWTYAPHAEVRALIGERARRPFVTTWLPA